MSDYRHILLAIDYSAHSDYVANKAKALADCYQAKLSIIHVLDNIPMPDTNYGSIIPINEDTGYELLEIEKTKLIELSKRLEIADDNQWLVWGVPNQEIVACAIQQKVDLIILGSHGRHGLALLLGSTANSVLHHAPCDVLAVRLLDN
ncbi:MAG: universal stress protein [Methylococcales bacterium]